MLLVAHLQNRTSQSKGQVLQKSHQANAPKTLQKMDRRATTDRTPAPNSTYPKVAGQCKYERLYFKQTLVRLVSLVFQTATFG
jgi:hypothetical protein